MKSCKKDTFLSKVGSEKKRGKFKIVSPVKSDFASILLRESDRMQLKKLGQSNAKIRESVWDVPRDVAIMLITTAAQFKKDGGKFF